MRSYNELIQIPDFLGRFNYLKLKGVVGEELFGHSRYLNQAFYTSREWRDIRDYIILRDEANDMGLDGYAIHGGLYVHHINPITKEDLLNRAPSLLDPNNLISTSRRTHAAITYGDESLLPFEPVERFPGDTTPWRTGGDNHR